MMSISLFAKVLGPTAPIFKPNCAARYISYTHQALGGKFMCDSSDIIRLISFIIQLVNNIIRLYNRPYAANDFMALFGQ